MKEIRIQKKIESEMLELPELRQYFGHMVEITVRDVDETPSEYSPAFLERFMRGWQGDELVRADQGVSEERDPLP